MCIIMCVDDDNFVLCFSLCNSTFNTSTDTVTLTEIMNHMNCNHQEHEEYELHIYST